MKLSRFGNFLKLYPGYNFSLHPMYALWLKYKTPFSSIIYFAHHMCPSFGLWWSEGGAMRLLQSANLSRIASGYNFSLHPTFVLWLK